MRILQVLHWYPEFPYNNAKFFERRGDVVENLLLFADEAVPDPRHYGAVIVYGGYMSAYDDANHPWIAQELRFLETCLKAEVPVLGICLGSQLLARLLGARVYRSSVPEFGFTDIRLTAEGANDRRLGPLGRSQTGGSFLSIEWHNDAWDLPAGAVRLAESARWPNEAFSYGDRTLAIQFHLEFTQAHMAWAVGNRTEDVPTYPGAESATSFVSDPQRFETVCGNMETLLAGFLPRG